MLEIRKGTATKNYENTFFREFADNLKKMFDKYSLDGLLIANSECEAESRLQIDALLITPKAVCIIDFKNFGGKITLPKNAKSEFDFGVWTNENGEPIKGGSSINPFIQLKTQKERFIKVVERQIQAKLPLRGSSFNVFHTVRAVCFQKPIELVGKIPTNEELNFFIFDKSNYLETIKDIIDISDKEVTLTKESFDLFKEVFRADIFDTSEKYDQANDFTSYHTELDFENLYPDQKLALNEIENFIKSEDEKIFILQGTSLSGKTHLIPFIQDVAFNNQTKEVKLFASSSRISNNLLKSSNLEFESIYSYIYGGNSTVVNEKENEEENQEENEAENNEENKAPVIEQKEEPKAEDKKEEDAAKSSNTYVKVAGAAAAAAVVGTGFWFSGFYPAAIALLAKAGLALPAAAIGVQIGVCAAIGLATVSLLGAAYYGINKLFGSDTPAEPVVDNRTEAQKYSDKLKSKEDKIKARSEKLTSEQDKKFLTDLHAILDIEHTAVRKFKKDGAAMSDRNQPKQLDKLLVLRYEAKCLKEVVAAEGAKRAEVEAAALEKATEAAKKKFVA